MKEFNNVLCQRCIAYVVYYTELSPAMIVTFSNEMPSRDKERHTSKHEPQLLGLNTETYFQWSHFMIGNKLDAITYEVDSKYSIFPLIRKLIFGSALPFR
jgi:hypothetical protein